MKSQFVFAEIISHNDFCNILELDILTFIYSTDVQLITQETEEMRNDLGIFCAVEVLK